MNAQTVSDTSSASRSAALFSAAAVVAGCVLFLRVTVGFSAAREVAVAAAGVTWLVLAGYCIARREVFSRTSVSAAAVATVASITGVAVVCSTWSTIPADLWMVVLLSDLGIRLFCALASYRYRTALESLAPMARASALLRLGGWLAIAAIPADVMSGRTITALYEVFAVSAAVTALAAWEAKRSKDAVVQSRRIVRPGQAPALSVTVGELSVTVDGGVLVAATQSVTGSVQHRVELPQLVDLSERSAAPAVQIPNKPSMAPSPTPTAAPQSISNVRPALDDQPVVVFDLAAAETAAEAAAAAIEKRPLVKSVPPKIVPPTIILEETSYGVAESVTVSLDEAPVRDRQS